MHFYTVYLHAWHTWNSNNVYEYMWLNHDFPQTKSLHNCIASWSWYLMCCRFSELKLFDSWFFVHKSVISFNIPGLLLCSCLQQKHSQRQWKLKFIQIHKHNTPELIRWNTLFSSFTVNTCAHRVTQYTKWAFIFSFKYEECLNLRWQWQFSSPNTY